MGFIEYIYNDRDNQSVDVTKDAVALLGDMANTFHNIGSAFAQKPYTIQFVQEAATSGNSSLTDTAIWAQNAIQTAMQQKA